MATKKKAEPKAANRPTKYTTELGESICREIATTENGIHKVAKNHGLTASTVFLWLITHKEFSDNYAMAKDLQMELMAERIVSIADDATRDTIQTEKGDIPNHEWINRSRLRVDTRKWLMSKLARKKYGDSVDVTSDGDKISAPIIIDWHGAAPNNTNPETEGGA